MTELQKSQLAALIRLLLIFSGGWLAKKGISVDVASWTDMVIAALGGLQVLVAFIWSLKQKAAVAPAVAMAKQVEEGTVFLTRAEIDAENRGYEEDPKKS